MCRVVRFGPLLGSAWWQDGTLEALRRLGKHQEELVAAYPSGISSITILHNGLNAPPASVREEATEMLRRFADVTFATAHVIPIDGFKHAFFRTMLAGFALVARTSAKTKVFQSPDEAIEWLGELPAQHESLRASSGWRQPLRDALMTP